MKKIDEIFDYLDRSLRIFILLLGEGSRTQQSS